MLFTVGVDSGGRGCVLPQDDAVVIQFTLWHVHDGVLLLGDLE